MSKHPPSGGLATSSFREGFEALLDRGDVPTKVRTWLLAINVASFIALCLTVFARQRPIVMFRYDGTVLLSTERGQSQWMGSGLSYTMDFLQGIGGLWWAQVDTLYLPAKIVSSLFADDFMPVVGFTVHATEFFLTTVLLGLCLRLRANIALGGAWLGSLVAFPFFVPTLATDMLWGNPHALTLIAIVSAALCLIIRIGRDIPWSVAAATTLLLLGAYASFVYAGAIVQGIPAIVIIGAAILCTSSSRAEALTRSAAVIGTAAILIAVFGPFLAGLYADTKGAIFPAEMWARPLDIHNISHLLSSNARLMGPGLWFLALGGAALSARFATGALRGCAIGFCALAAFIILVVALLATLYGTWWGPNPAYFDIYAFALTSLFAAMLLRVLVRVSHAVRWPGAARRFASYFSARPLASAIALALVPWTALVVATPPYANPRMFAQDPWLWPPKATAITELLQRETGLSDGATFRGRTATLSGKTFSKDLAFAPFASQHNYDQVSLYFTGNDHRLYGLWYFDIPTLIENNHFTSPFVHLTTTRLLNEGPTLATHAQIALTKFDPRVLQAYGVRFVVSDEPLPTDTLRLELNMHPQWQQYVYELPRPNVGDYSPTRVVYASDATDAMRHLASPDFDFSDSVVLTDQVTSSEWVSANDGTLQVFRDHLSLRATSDGISIVVLPVEFSHCLEFDLVSTGDEPIEVRRANLAQVAVIFSRSVAGSIALRYGPFTNATCRLADYADARSLNIAKVPRDVTSSVSEGSASHGP